MQMMEQVKLYYICSFSVWLSACMDAIENHALYQDQTKLFCGRILQGIQ